MSVNILMPALSPTMTEGKLSRWLKKEGDAIHSGDVIAEIETDKATMEVEAVDDGLLGRILVSEGTEGVKVNAPIAIVVAEGESVPDDAAPVAAAPAAAPVAAAPVSEAKAPAIAAAPAVPQGAAPAPAQGTRVFASPLARRIAAQKGIDLSGVKGSGPNGRIVRRDVESATAAPVAAPVPSPAPSAPAAAIEAPHTAVPNSTIRKVIARRLTEAKSTIPHFYVAMDVELDALLDLRAKLNAASPAEGPGAFKLSVNDMLIKAVAVTLRRVPKVNASYTEDATILYDDVDVSVAVSIADGLITPIVRQADRKSLREISEDAKDLITRARAGKLKPQEFQGGSFSISNMGMYGVKEFSAIINPPQAAILAIAAAEKRAVVKDDAIRIATVMTVTLSVDHRVVDGALAAEWVSTFRSVVESPLSLVV
ncbi:pyruvate dehydrogenase complex dihydrolipoamide acetyltransferase [Gluconacetobacter diazotrophicus PA1 5]|uniref:Acetyltransferase component of pyruvate dehydrogenase complex n=2 Tax=Gluconacetobacter diazotrophicus TaxID=33996 RepID=A9HJB2_GLUDA|nr:pyruvate dehydrogenase complex dihydrolipoamide acetyltransferase [Gluconacetobacter diazotrophicus]ACI49963.1 pyruvate dehydrogenase complex dihydrolipoamide acetyltransferase [Gluconacetobacter diazotrophicus PA1 5]MBB2156514.1 pyruvate dehydrogenase complex dihydrolipoamide acetyltransferase [Gluconacetobacter diazotrophicus]TWB06007.1 pyruvate dehydrogenase E2 component (dihydrolipoamide acetyltransferase) [Gluconacetobacter diazotrophicus]CAP55884.1 Dihydrolipoamid acetyltransferase com